MHFIKYALFAAIAVGAVPAMAQWQWVDAQGRKVFSDRPPPPEVPSRNIVRQPSGSRLGLDGAAATAGAQSGPASAAPAAAPSTAAPGDKQAGGKQAGVDKALEEQKRKQQAQEAEKAQAERARLAKVRQENCQRAKQAKDTLVSGRLLSNVNAQGERSFMDEATRAAEVERADRVIASDCGPMPEPAPAQ